jgi:nicotinate-nucleotide adenylyltransferase
MVIGLMGGSFNPAHKGHKYIAEQAIQRFGLHQVWWMISPQNPLKPAQGMAPFTARLRSAETIATHPQIIPTRIEHDLGTRYTADTLQQLQQRFPRASFIWIMGADNLASFHKWKHWHRIARHIPMAIFDRAPQSLSAISSPAARRYAHARIPPHQMRAVLRHPPIPARIAPCWCFVPIARHPASSTAIRAKFHAQDHICHEKQVAYVKEP